MAKTIAFVDNFDELEIFLKTFKYCINNETTFIAGDAMAFAALKNRGIQSRALDDYRNQREYEDAENYAIELAEKWFIDYEGTDLTVFEGISLGRSMKRDVIPYFLYLLKAILDVSNILKYENPEKVLLIRDYSVSTGLFGKNGLFLHKKVFEFLMKNKKCELSIGKDRINEAFFKLKNVLRQFRFVRQSIPSVKLFYYSPLILNRFFKKIVIRMVDETKGMLLKNEGNSGFVRALTLSATDLTYFGTTLIESFLKKDNCYIYYFEDENNCYFNSRILRVLKRKYSSIIKNQKMSKYMSDLKFRFEKSKNIEKNASNWMFIDLPLINFAEEYLNEIVEKKIPELISFLLLAEDAIKRENISIVLISERWLAKRVILAKIAKRNGLSVLHIPHSVDSSNKVANKIIPSPLHPIHYPFYPTHEVSSLKCIQENQISSGISQDKLYLTGVSRYENFNPKTRKMYYEARKRLKLPLDEEIVFLLVGSIFSPYYDKALTHSHISSFKKHRIYESFLKLFLKRTNSKIVFKLKMHDVSTKWLINDIMAKNGMNNVLIFRDHLHDLLIASDAVVVRHSDVGIEALYRDTPVIVYNDPDNPTSLPLVAERVGIEIKFPEELIPVLDRLRNDESYRQKRLKVQRDFLLRNLPSDEMSSAERVSNVINTLAKKNGE